MNNPFLLFNLPESFEIDKKLLNEQYLNLQKALHPDKFAHCSAQEQRLAIQKSAQINDALETLKNPISRAECLIALHTNNTDDSEKSSQDMAFLMQQMQWRELLEEIETSQNMTQYTALCDEVDVVEKNILKQLQENLANQDWDQAKVLVDRLKFMHKLQIEIERLEDLFMDF